MRKFLRAYELDAIMCGVAAGSVALALVQGNYLAAAWATTAAINFWRLLMAKQEYETLQAYHSITRE